MQGYGWKRARASSGGDGGVVGGPDGADRRPVRESRVVRPSRDDVPRVGDLPKWPIPVIPVHLAMAAARKIAALERVALLLVERDDTVVGYLNERTLATAPDDAPVADFVTRLDRCLHPAMSIADARRCFISARAGALPVVVAGFVLGAMARRDVERNPAARASGAGPVAPSPSTAT